METASEDIKFAINNSYALGVIMTIASFREDYKEICKMIEDRISNGEVILSTETLEICAKILEYDVDEEKRIETILFLIGGEVILQEK